MNLNELNLIEVGGNAIVTDPSFTQFNMRNSRLAVEFSRNYRPPQSPLEFHLWDSSYGSLTLRLLHPKYVPDVQINIHICGIRNNVSYHMKLKNKIHFITETPPQSVSRAGEWIDVPYTCKYRNFFFNYSVAKV